MDYLFGQPFFNETLGNITGLIPVQWDWTWLDRNISQFMQYMWVNFTRYGSVGQLSSHYFLNWKTWWFVTCALDGGHKR